MDAAEYGCHKQCSKLKKQLVRIFEINAAIKCWNSELSRCRNVRQAYHFFDWAEDWRKDPIFRGRIYSRDTNADIVSSVSIVEAHTHS
jgi:hypothetical protein